MEVGASRTGGRAGGGERCGILAGGTGRGAGRCVAGIGGGHREGSGQVKRGRGRGSFGNFTDSEGLVSVTASVRYVNNTNYYATCSLI